MGLETGIVFSLDCFLGLSYFCTAGLRALRQKTSQAHQDGSEEVASRPGFFSSWRDIPMALRMLLCNPVLMCCALATVTEGMLVAGYITFLPKLIQNQFGQTAAWAALLTGKSD